MINVSTLIKDLIILSYVIIFSQNLEKMASRALIQRVKKQLVDLNKVSVRHEGIFTKYREPPNGFLFNRKPLKPGEKREWEPWQKIWYVGWSTSALILAVGTYYRPDESILVWGRREAFKRIAEIEGTEDSE
uniref:NADH dehydrogenase [ubiquinone] 1 beta subcomplex subunit 11, mitochondrial n=1 Tax=Clytia hemisphaerica TaxID=252671 RepID=A0A7M5X4E6_9CNID